MRSLVALRHIASRQAVLKGGPPLAVHTGALQQMAAAFRAVSAKAANDVTWPKQDAVKPSHICIPK